MSTQLKINKLEKFYTGKAGSKLHVLHDINFTLNSDQLRKNFVSILAPFASGKSTLLKIIAGIEKPTEGKLFLNEKEYTENNSEIVYISEEPSSFPWLNVEQNIKLALNLKKDNKKNVNDLISLVGLDGYEKHFPNDKSYGFRFRISLARALAVSPKIILLDDPFKKIDAETRNEIYEVIKFLCNQSETIFILATTNISEAIYLSEKIFLMKKNPGTIFHEMKLEKGFNELRDEKFKSVRREIESLFKLEKVINDINFSI